MTHLQTLFAGLVTIVVTSGLASSTAATPDAPAEFQIMSDQEMAAHSAMMQGLQGAARDDYRNAQYRQLRQRAMQHGYRMPASPPWAAPGAAPAMPPPVAAPDPQALAVAEAADRHAAMREKLQALGGPPTTAATPAPPIGQAADAVAPAAESADAQAPAASTASVDPPATPQADSATPQDPSPATTEPAPGPSFADRPQPTPPAAPTATPLHDATTRFAPPGETVQPPATATAAAAAAAAGSVQPAAGTRPDRAAHAPSDAMTAYRETMRARFDRYMQERQARHEETIRRQREQLEAGIGQDRRRQAPHSPYQPPPPPMPTYGPRYPGALPGYRQPYWLQR